MKQIFLIGGVPRSGKSIVRKKLLNSHNVSSGIGTDNLREMLDYGNSSLDISHKNTPKENLRVMEPYFDALIKNQIKYSPESLILEGDILLPQFLNKYKNNKKIKSCFIGYSKIDIKNKLACIYSYPDSANWIKNKPEKEAIALIKWFVSESKKYRIQCSNLKIKYFDTSVDFEKNLNKIINYLIK